MKILISGASGLLGMAITLAMEEHGHKVLALHRKPGSAAPFWNIAQGVVELGDHQNIDVVINLAGESIVEGRWSQRKKDRIKSSRVEGTKLLAEYFSKATYQPKLFISGSAVGFYGSRDDEWLLEESEKGTGFLSDVCEQWEAAAGIASQSGIRAVFTRHGMVLTPNGGALKKMLPPFKMGIGGVIGSGRQYISWVTINDVVGAIGHIIKDESISGPINIVSPNPVTNYEFTKALGNAVNRPALIPLPEFLAKGLFGEMAQELLLASARVTPSKLLDSGYVFKNETLASALHDLL